MRDISCLPASGADAPVRGGALRPLLFASGAAALLLQVLWARDFALLFGATAVGTAVVLCAFFAGLMLGAEAGGRLLRRHAGRATFVAVEAGICLATLAYVLLLRPRLGEMALDATRLAGPGLEVAARAAIALGVLVVPTTLIGATLPAALATVAGRDASLTARLYAWNTLGGAAGALGALVAIASLGARRSFFVAAALDAGVAVLAWHLLPRSGAGASASRARGVAAGAPTTPAEGDRALRRGKAAAVPLPAAAAIAAGVAVRGEAGAAPAPAPERGRALLRAALVASLAGFAGLADEVLWTRGLAGVVSNSVYSIALVLATVLLGLVAGASVSAPLVRRRAQVGSALVAACLALAGATLLSRAALPLLPSAARGLATALRASDPVAGFAVEAALGVLVVLLPSICLGMILPLCVAASGDETVAGLGRVLAANTAGGLLGAPLAAFLLLPAVGLGGGLALTAALACVAAVVATERAAVRAGAVAAAAALVALALVAPRLQVPWLGGVASERVLFYRDGAAATVLVTEGAGGGKRLLVNGQYSLGGTDGLLLERRQAHLPLLLHPAPRRVLVLGVGTAATLGAALTHPEVQADAVEIVPEVLDAARLFDDENDAVLDDPRARVVADDARSFLAGADARYDVILSDLFLPWTAGTAYLYSSEIYELGRSRLTPGGIYCQWLPLHQLALADLQAIVATFAQVFPETTLWLAYHRAGAPIAALVGSTEPLPFDAAALAVRLASPGMAAARRVGLDAPAELALLYVTDGPRLRAATAGTPPISDDRPRLEFSAPAAYFHQPGLAAAAVAWLAEVRDPSAASPVADAVSPEARGALLDALLALTRVDGPGELARYVEVLALEPGLAAPRRALAAIARSRTAAGDQRTAEWIAARLDRAAPP